VDAHTEVRGRRRRFKEEEEIQGGGGDSRWRRRFSAD
jgi:hypothetical protein